jgi:hypothetical protein
MNGVVLFERMNFSAENAEDAELLWRLRQYCGGWWPLQAVELIEPGYFSAKDAKDAKFY